MSTIVPTPAAAAAASTATPSTPSTAATSLPFNCGICSRQLTDMSAILTSCGHFFCASPPAACTRLRHAAGAPAVCEQCGQPCEAGRPVHRGTGYDARVQSFVFDDVVAVLHNAVDVLKFRENHRKILSENAHSLRVHHLNANKNNNAARTATATLAAGAHAAGQGGCSNCDRHRERGDALARKLEAQQRAYNDLRQEFATMSRRLGEWTSEGRGRRRGGRQEDDHAQGGAVVVAIEGVRDDAGRLREQQRPQVQPQPQQQQQLQRVRERELAHSTDVTHLRTDMSDSSRLPMPTAQTQTRFPYTSQPPAPQPPQPPQPPPQRHVPQPRHLPQPPQPSYPRASTNSLGGRRRQGLDVERRTTMRYTFSDTAGDDTFAWRRANGAAAARVADSFAGASRSIGKQRRRSQPQPQPQPQPLHPPPPPPPQQSQPQPQQRHSFLTTMAPMTTASMPMAAAVRARRGERATFTGTGAARELGGGSRLLALAGGRQRRVASVPLGREAPIERRAFHARGHHRSFVDGEARRGGGENR